MLESAKLKIAAIKVFIDHVLEVVVCLHAKSGERSIAARPEPAGHSITEVLVGGRRPAIVLKSLAIEFLIVGAMVNQTAMSYHLNHSDAAIDLQNKP
jgi:hypothetical protein